MLQCLLLVLLSTLLPAAPDARAEEETCSITISAVGDCTLCRNQLMGYENSWEKAFHDYGSRYFLSKVRKLFQEDDLTIANLECALSDRAKPLHRFYRERYGTTVSKQYIHIGKPKYLAALTKGGVDAVSFANNHNIDGGLIGYTDTLDACDAQGVAVAAYDRLVRVERNGILIGIVSIDLTYCKNKTAERILRAGMADLNRDCDLIIACMHWGKNYERLPSETQKKFGHLCIDLGADLVIGCHAHILQGIERYRGRYICYSLGNFTYGGRGIPKDPDTMIVQQTFTFVDGELQVDDAIRVFPCKMSGSDWRNDYRPILCTGEASEQVITKLNNLSRRLGLHFDKDGFPRVEPETDTELPLPPVAEEPLQPAVIPEPILVMLGSTADRENLTRHNTGSAP